MGFFFGGSEDKAVKDLLEIEELRILFACFFLDPLLKHYLIYG